ncbi:MAG TPA: tetratricopeptide repeat protein [Terriglobia bacterium]|nr:tetratricopeptide repeat protein [Terriglobia bacterium]
MSGDSGNGGRRRRLNIALLVLGLVLVFNAAYLAAYATPDLFYVANVLLHPFLGVLAAVLFVLYLKRHKEFFTSLSGGICVLGLAVATGFGLFLFFAGMTSAHTLALYLHVGFAIGGLFFLLVRLRTWARDGRKFSFIGSPWQIAASGFVAALIFYGGVSLYHHYFPNPWYQVRNPLTAPVTMYGEGGGRNSLMFPNSAQTSDGGTIPKQFFLNSKSCEPCHKDIYNQWEHSMHHFSSFNNQWYRKAIEYMQDTIGIKPSMWCAGCHDHALAFTDVMQKYPIRKIEFSPEGQAGLGCMSCHAIAHIDSTMGNGSFVMHYPQLDRLVTSKSPWVRYIANFSILLNPKPHSHVFLKPFHHERKDVAEFCSACHKVHLGYPVNHYRWTRGFNDYDNWQGSGISGNSARSFYYPPKPMVCIDCHMPMVRSHDFGNIDGYVHSHRFVAANTAVPTSHGDASQAKDVEEFLKGAVTVDLFAIAEEPQGKSEETLSRGTLAGGPQASTMFAVGEESARGFEASEVSAVPPARLMAPINRGVAYLRRGETARVEVVVRTRRVGHFFPGGTVDAFDCWVELKGVDDKGHTIFWSGEVADNGKGPVDPAAHFYRSLSLDEHGHWINKRNAWSAHATVYARLIPPGAADTVHFRIKVPKDCGDKITFTAKLDYRKFDWWNTQWAFAGRRDPYQKDRQTTLDYDNTHWLFDGSLANVSARVKQIPDVPVVVMSQDVATIPVRAASNEPFQQDIKLLPDDIYRWNDYGIGLLLQGDLKGAARAFKIVTKINPKYADGWVNVARALVQEGNVGEAVPYLKKALALDPMLASAYYFMGEVYLTKGDYPQALSEYSKAYNIHPGDRVVSNAIGHILFLQRKYRQAVKQFQYTLSIDPEDLIAHYNLMLCYRGLQDNTKSNHEEKLYMRFKADEISKAITGPYELTHPDDNIEAQPIHEHVSINEEAPEGLQFYWNYGQRWDWLAGKAQKEQQIALARYKKDGSYGYLAAMRKDKLKMRAAHKVMARHDSQPQKARKVAAGDKLHARPAHKIVAETRSFR